MLQFLKLVEAKHGRSLTIQSVERTTTKW